METIIISLIIAIPVFYLFNKFLDRQFGIRPNQNIIDRLSRLESVNSDISELSARVDNHAKAIKEVNKRIDGMIIQKII